MPKPNALCQTMSGLLFRKMPAPWFAQRPVGCIPVPSGNIVEMCPGALPLEEACPTNMQRRRCAPLFNDDRRGQRPPPCQTAPPAPPNQRRVATSFSSGGTNVRRSEWVGGLARSPGLASGMR